MRNRPYAPYMWSNISQQEQSNNCQTEHMCVCVCVLFLLLNNINTDSNKRIIVANFVKN